MEKNKIFEYYNHNRIQKQVTLTTTEIRLAE